MKYNEDQIRDAVIHVVGDGGKKAEQVINALRIMTGVEMPKFRQWVDENGNFRIEVIK